MTVAALLLTTGAVQAEVVTCSGYLSSVQGGGLLANRTFRFDVGTVSGGDLKEVLEKCQKIAQDKQNWAARKNPGGSFKKFSDIDLQCAKGAEKFRVKRSLQTGF